MPNTSFIIKNAEYVEVPIPTGNTRSTIYFPDLPNLRNRPIFGIECYPSTTQGTLNSGATNQAISDLVNASLTLYFDGGEFIVIPILSLIRLNTGAASHLYYDIPHFGGQNVVWTKSYVSMNAGVANFAGHSFLFNVYYTK
jgi:hypothetical protein